MRTGRMENSRYLVIITFMSVFQLISPATIRDEKAETEKVVSQPGQAKEPESSNTVSENQPLFVNPTSISTAGQKNNSTLSEYVVKYFKTLSPSETRIIRDVFFTLLVDYPPGTEVGDLFMQLLSSLQRENMEKMLETRMMPFFHKFPSMETAFVQIEKEIMENVTSVMEHFKNTLEEVSKLTPKKVIQQPNETVVYYKK